MTIRIIVSIISIRSLVNSGVLIQDHHAANLHLVQVESCCLLASYSPESKEAADELNMKLLITS